MKSPSHKLANRSFIVIVFLAIIVLIFWLSACRFWSDQAGGEVLDLPQEPGAAVVIVEDARADGDFSTWMAQYISGGTWADTWFVNQYERPFTAGAMEYQPFLDIREARLRPAGEWTVFEIQAVEPATNERVYISLEIDTDLDNRPDLLILTRAVEETSWNDLMISILVDLNKDAGGNRPRLAEPFEDSWNGFEVSYDSEISQAYVRRSPDSEVAYQIAVNKVLLGGDQYIWRVWLEGEIFHPGWVEYNDRYSLAEAGSPYLYSPNFPLKALASIDNTCLHFFGGEITQPQPGFCDSIIDLSGEETLPPDDQFANPDGENSVSIIFPSSDPGEGEVDPDPTLMVFDPGYFFQPTPTSYPNLQEFPTMEFEVPETQEGPYVAAVATPLMAEAVVATPAYAESFPVPTVIGYGVVAETQMFDPYQGSSPTPKPEIHNLIMTPTPPVKPIFHWKTPTPTP